MEEIIVEGIEEFRESEVRITGNKVELTREDYDKLNEDLEIAQLQLQEANDTLNGGITNRNMAHLRNTYCINASDSLDNSFPMYVYFRVLDETINIVSVKVSYWIHKYRAYSKAAAAGGGQTSSSVETPSGGGSTTPSGGGSTTPSGGGATSGVYNRGHTHTIRCYDSSETTYPVYIHYGTPSYLLANIPNDAYMIGISDPNQDHTHATPAHIHATPAHTHATPDHTHPAHTHTVANHTHDADYGIYEEDNTPIIKFSVSQDGGIYYSDAYGNQAIDQELIDITDSITKTGSKILKFESTTRARLTVQVEIKVDISVR